MSDFEQDLRKALSHRDPPPGFADRVVARVPRRTFSRQWLALAAAILIVIAGLSMWQLRQREARLAADRARADLIRALEITTSSLETARILLQRQTERKTL